jgi:hypothetical protein
MSTAFCFDYYCARCDAPFCERVHIMNLALNYIDDELCLSCLAADHGQDEAGLSLFVRDYVEARECFKTPWDQFDATGCPRQETATCHCQDPGQGGV